MRPLDLPVRNCKKACDGPKRGRRRRTSPHPSLSRHRPDKARRASPVPRPYDQTEGGHIGPGPCAARGRAATVQFMLISELVERALNLEPPTPEEGVALLRRSDAETPGLVTEVSRVRRRFFEDRVKLNFLLNIKSGLCPEDCHYCSQSKLSSAAIQRYRMLTAAEAVEAAGMALAAGAKRFCMVASGRGPTPRELDHFTEAVRQVKAAHPRLEICACLGLLREGQAEQLVEAGVYAYNHNLNTSESHYAEICETHTYADRIDTVRRAAAAGLSPCSGVLFGMGETDEEFVDAGLALRGLRPDSVPV